MTGRGLSLGPCLCPAPVILAREPAGGCVRRGGWGGQQGRQGPGCARACQRVPRVIYDVRPMSLSAGLFGAGCIQQLDRQAGLPPGPPSPFPLPLARAPRACLLWIFCHSLPLCLCLSAFLGFCVPTSPGSLPSQLHPSEFPWLSPVS